MRDWLGPTLGAALMLAGAAGLAYKVISGYRHPAPEAFISVQDQNKLRAASTADHPVESPTISADAAATARNTTTPTDLDARAEARDNSACIAIKTERHEIEGALRKSYSRDEGRYLQKRLLELTEQSVKSPCVE